MRGRSAAEAILAVRPTAAAASRLRPYFCILLPFTLDLQGRCKSGPPHVSIFLTRRSHGSYTQLTKKRLSARDFHFVWQNCHTNPPQQKAQKPLCARVLHRTLNHPTKRRWAASKPRSLVGSVGGADLSILYFSELMKRWWRAGADESGSNFAGIITSKACR